MPLVFERLDLGEVRKGIAELFKRYPGLVEEYKDNGIKIKYDSSRKVFYSAGGVEVDVLPEVFKNCKGTYGCGWISISNIAEYDESVLNRIIESKVISAVGEDYCSYNVDRAGITDFAFKDFVPKIGSKSWTPAKRLPERIRKFVNELADSDNDILGLVSRLHMVGEYPVISTSSMQNGTDDYGFAEVVLQWTKGSPIKDVYIVLGKDTGHVSSYVRKKHSDGEYTITVF